MFHNFSLWSWIYTNLCIYSITIIWNRYLNQNSSLGLFTFCFQSFFINFLTHHCDHSNMFEEPRIPGKNHCMLFTMKTNIDCKLSYHLITIYWLWNQSHSCRLWIISLLYQNGSLLIFYLGIVSFNELRVTLQILLISVMSNTW